MRKALTDDVRIGFDGVTNDVSAPRLTLQFPVSPDLYDWFYNARTGYRAQFWISPDTGLAFNAGLISRLRGVVDQWAPPVVDGREIWVVKHNDAREDVDKGTRSIERAVVLASLDPGLSKIWICERRIRHDGERPDPMPFGLVDPKLKIPRWEGNGLLAPFPENGRAWLDVKGAYVQSTSKVEQPNKSPLDRARKIHCTGWT